MRTLARLTGLVTTAALIVGLAGCGAQTGAASTATGAASTATGSVAAQASVARAQPSGSFTVLAEPAAGIAPFVSMINTARHTVALTMYELYDTSIERALAAAAARGVNVRVALDGGYYGDRDETNGAAYAYLKAHGVAVRYTPSYFALTHQKTLTIDTTESAIMTLNFDAENHDTRDYAVIDRSRADIARILTVFNDDWSSTRTGDASSGDLVFSPGAQPTYISLVAGARQSIDLEAEELSYRPAIDALCDAARRGIALRVVMNYDSDYTNALQRLARCGASVRLYHSESYYIHAKLLIVDGTTVLVGSQNLTTTSLKYNRELSILLHVSGPIRTLTTDFNADFAGAQPLA